MILGLLIATAGALYMLATWLLEPTDWGGWLTVGDYDRGWR